MADEVTAEDYRRQAQALLPQGPAWPRETDALITYLLNGLSEEFARVHNRDIDLLAEMIPISTVEMLEDWERVAGLPDACAGTLETLDLRRRALLTKLATLGGQDAVYFIGLAAIFGWTIEIFEYRRFRAGLSSAGDAVSNDTGDDDGWVHVWRVKSDSPISYFGAGIGVAGEPLAAWGNTPLECMLNAWKPAQTFIIFDYS